MSLDPSEIAVRRNKLGLTQEELAIEAMVSPNLIAKIEKGLVKPSLNELANIFNALIRLENRLNTKKGLELTKVNAIHNRNVMYATADEPLFEAQKRMKKMKYSQLPVKFGDIVCGSITEKGISSLILPNKKDLVKLKVKDVMEHSFPLVTVDTPVHRIVPILKAKQAILTVKDRAIEGIVTNSDVEKLYLRPSPSPPPKPRGILTWELKVPGKKPTIKIPIDLDHPRPTLGREETYVPSGEAAHGPVVKPVERYVNTFFSSTNNPKELIIKTMPLMPDTDYYFMFWVGSLHIGSYDVTRPEPIDTSSLPPGAKLTVALFAFEGEIELTPGQETGEIEIDSFEVVRPVICPPNISEGDKILKKKLFFPIKTPDKEGQARLRCNIYFKQILIESRLIKAQISSSQKPSHTQMIQVKTEYTISKTLNANNFGRIKPQLLSIMLNDNKDGTHSFRFKGEENLNESVNLGNADLKSDISKARGTLRKASWDTEEPQTDEPYLYKGKWNEKKLLEDLEHFALQGYRFWFNRFVTLLADKIRPGQQINPSKILMKIMLKHGIIEFAIKDPIEASKYMFPISMIYDYPINTQTQSKFTLCPSFLEARESEEKLEATECFKGNCPNYGNKTVICPSGFWGFRHSIGLPMGIGAPEIKPDIKYNVVPEVDCAAFNFKSWEKHKNNLISLKRDIPIPWQIKDTPDDTINLLQTTNPHLVYFYCEGGADNNIPYIQVGDRYQVPITPDNFSPELCWFDPMPLVFINGCRTAALNPELMMNFVSAFVTCYHASGVVGTEIQVFEQLASVFGEKFLQRFLVDGKRIGDALRETRLELLKEGNPLGLVYNAYANASLRLVKAE